MTLTKKIAAGLMLSLSLFTANTVFAATPPDVKITLTPNSASADGKSKVGVVMNITQLTGEGASATQSGVTGLSPTVTIVPADAGKLGEVVDCKSASALELGKCPQDIAGWPGYYYSELTTGTVSGLATINVSLPDLPKPATAALTLTASGAAVEPASNPEKQTTTPPPASQIKTGPSPIGLFALVAVALWVIFRIRKSFSSHEQ